MTIEKNPIKIAVLDGQASSWEECIRLTGQKLLERGYVNQSFADACITREKSYPTGIPSVNPIAIPHTTSDHVITDSICVLRLKKPVLFQRMDDPESAVSVQLVLNLAMKGGESQIDLLSRLMDLLNTDDFYSDCFIDDKDRVEILISEKVSV